MKETAVTATGVIDTFLLLLVGIGPKLALVPLLKITAPLDALTRARVRRKMLLTAGTVALGLVILGEVLRRLLHFTVESLSIAGGVILLVLAIQMVLENGSQDAWSTSDSDPMRLATVPLAVPYLLNPVGIVGGAAVCEAGSVSVFAAEIAVLLVVLVIDAGVFVRADRAGDGADEDRLLVVEKVFGFLVARQLAREEGLLVGGSGGTTRMGGAGAREKPRARQDDPVDASRQRPLVPVEVLRRQLDARARVRGAARAAADRRAATRVEAGEEPRFRSSSRSRAPESRRGDRRDAALFDLAGAGRARRQQRLARGFHRLAAGSHAARPGLQES